VTTPPGWAQADWAGDIAEPFRSSGQFWSGLAAATDAVVALAAAAAAGAVLAVAGAGAWASLPFLLPAVLLVRAAVISRSSSRSSRAAFSDRQAWRDAERSAVAGAFLRVLRRPRTRRA
jgi:hypothetical protein